MNNLILIKSENFGNIQCDFYKDEKDMYCMTSEQLGMALGYSDPRKSVSNIVIRNPYLQNEEFSGGINLMTPGGTQETRVFTEDGIYEVTMLAKTDRAREFRSFVRGILKGLRTGKIKMVNMTEYQRMSVEAKINNSKARTASILLKIAEKPEVTLEYRKVLYSHATSALAGMPLLPLPAVERKTYSATEIGQILGVSSQKIGVIANQHSLKTEQYGKLFYDKAKHSHKQVETWRYYEEAIQVIKNLLDTKLH